MLRINRRMAIRYAWDPKKAAANRAKHGVSFEMAKEVFKNPLAVRNLDDLYGEERSTIVGMVGNRLLVVVFTEGSDGAIRIISARKATAHERRKYQEG